MRLACCVLAFGFICLTANAQCNDGVIAAELPKAGHPDFPVEKYALIIGNSKYQNTTKVPEAVVDSKLMFDAFRSMGIVPENIIRKENAEKSDFFELTEQLACRIKPGDIAIFYYSGHGMEIDRENYLIGIDALEPNRRVPQFELFPLSALIDIVTERRPSAMLIVLDACRNNPFPGVYGGRKSTTDGPANMDLADFRNTLVVYAASPGMPAYQWPETDLSRGQGSAFTRYLSDSFENLKAPLYEQIRNTLRMVAFESNCPSSGILRHQAA
jgi:hypothetical protein